MTEIKTAASAGACYGVERALRMVERASLSLEGPLYTLGPLIHNPRVIADLERRGVRVVQSPREAKGHALILRTHGTTRSEAAEAHELCPVVFDATCPFVKKMHKSVEYLVAQGYSLVVIGEQGHPEVEVTLSLAPVSYAVATVEEARQLPHLQRVGVVAQTTFRLELFEEIIGLLATTCDELKVINTICEATSTHQQSARELAELSDVMIVVGGRISANTTRLAEISRRFCPRTYHIEGPDELKRVWFLGAELVGITAGASTPSYQIDAVAAEISRLTQEANPGGIL